MNDIWQEIYRRDRAARQAIPAPPAQTQPPLRPQPVSLTPAVQVPACDYRRGLGRHKCYCHHPEIGAGRMVPYGRCVSCPANKVVENTSLQLVSLDAQPCRHLGEEIGRINSGCPACHNQPIRACAVHGQCVETQRQREEVRGARACAGCWQRSVGRHIPRVGSIRVGFLTPTLAIGGVERWLLTLAAATVDNDAAQPLEWVGCAVHGGGKIDRRTLAEVSTVMPVTHDRRQIFDSADVILAWAEGHAPDLGTVAGKVVHVIHGNSDWSRDCARKNAERTDLFIGVAVTATACAPRGRPALTIWNSIDPTRLQPRGTRAALRSRYGIDSGERVVCFVGRYSAEKQPLLAARAAAEIGGRSVYCASAQDKLWQQQIRGIDPRAVFLDQDAVSDAFLLSDCFAMGSLQEPYGLVFPEAWYCGCPVVSFVAGVVPYAESLAGCRLTERIGDHRTIGRACLAAMEQRQRVVVARETVLRHFLPERMAVEYQLAFARLLGRVEEP